jgi:sugar lactone lactonase YvrE
MVKYLFILFLPTFLSAQMKFSFVKKEGGYRHPESVCIVNEESVYIADIGKEMRPSELDSDGVLYKAPLKNLSKKEKVNKNFKLNAPKGITHDKNLLYITDIDRIVIVDTATGEKTDEIVFTDKTVFLNDIDMLEENTLLVTATNQHDMYAVLVKSKEIFNLSKKSMEGANGICVSTGKVYVCGFSNKENKKGHLYEYDLETNQVTVIVDQIGHLDGLKMHHDKLIMTDWGGDFNHGKIWEVDPKQKSATVISDHPDLKSPSDFDIYNNLMVVPCIDNGELLIFKWSN